MIQSWQAEGDLGEVLTVMTCGKKALNKQTYHFITITGILP